MVAPSVGSVVLVRFPFSDLSASKLRPAVVLAGVDRDDWIRCQVTSNPYSDSRALEITNADFASGSLMRVSYARPGQAFLSQYLSDAAGCGQFERVETDGPRGGRRRHSPSGRIKGVKISSLAPSR